MLVVTRRPGEQIVIDDDIIVTIVAVEGNKIRVGVQAPAHLRVDRKEVHERRAAEKAAGILSPGRFRPRVVSQCGDNA